MKSFAVLTLAIITIMINIAIILAIIVAIFSLKFHFFVTIQREYTSLDNQLSLINFLFYKYNSTLNVYRIISEREKINFNDYKDFLNTKGQNLFSTPCFKVLNSSGSLIFGNETCEAASYKGYSYIFRPYEDGLLEKLILVVR